MSLTTPFDESYWEARWQKGATGWDIGHASPAITSYFDLILDKEARILFPGCGSAWEGEYLHKQGFKNISLLDISALARQSFLSRVPSFNPDHYETGDFFSFKGSFDYVVEQTFFCAIDPNLRSLYAEHV